MKNIIKFSDQNYLCITFENYASRDFFLYASHVQGFPVSLDISPFLCNLNTNFWEIQSLDDGCFQVLDHQDFQLTRDSYVVIKKNNQNRQSEAIELLFHELAPSIKMSVHNHDHAKTRIDFFEAEKLFISCEKFVVKYKLDDGVTVSVNEVNYAPSCDCSDTCLDHDLKATRESRTVILDWPYPVKQGVNEEDIKANLKELFKDETSAVDVCKIESLMIYTCPYEKKAKISLTVKDMAMVNDLYFSQQLYIENRALPLAFELLHENFKHSKLYKMKKKFGHRHRKFYRTLKRRMLRRKRIKFIC